MKPKKVLASTLLTTALVFAPAGAAMAAPVTDASPPVVAVSDNHYDKHHYDKRHHDGDYKHHKHHDRGHKDHDRWDNNWRSNCFWLGPFPVCLPW